MTRRTASGRLAGILAATAALIATGFVSIGFYASYGGIVIAGGLAILVGSAVAGSIEPARTHTNAAIVAYYIVVLAAAYLLILPALVAPTQPGARGGPGVYPPAQRGGAPASYPPQR